MGGIASDPNAQATLSETQETKLVNIDEPYTVEPPEATDALTVAEVDTTVLGDEPVVVQPSVRHVPDEYASPIFAKRSRASYGPLFELDLDKEMEEDGGRRGKGRKRPRYSVQNGVWSYGEDSSPEPEQPQESSPAAQEQNGSADMLEATMHTEMADSVVQTNEAELPPAPSSSVSTPVKNWSQPQTSPLFGAGLTRALSAARTDTTRQASPSKPTAPVPLERREPTPTLAVSSPSGPAASYLGFSPVEINCQSGFGSPQGSAAPAHQRFGQSSSSFGAAQSGALGQDSAAPASQGFGQNASPFAATRDGGTGQGSTISTTHGFGQNSTLFGTASNGGNTRCPTASTNQAFPTSPSPFGTALCGAQISPLFGTGPAPTASASSSGSRVAGGTVRFRFGQDPQPAFGGSPFATSQAESQHSDAHPYPESFLDHQETRAHASLAPHNSFGIATQDEQPSHGFGTSARQDPIDRRAQDHSIPLWPLGSQDHDIRHAIGRVDVADDLRSDGGVLETTPPGRLPPEVEDGTRNSDETRQDGLLSQPVYRQDVPREALPDQEDASAGRDEDPMDSDDEADYDEDEKGDDYDLRNYDRVSDDEEGFDEEEEPLSDDELLEEDEQPFYGGDRGFDDNGYDEEDYEEHEAENYYSQASRLPSQPPPQPVVQREPVVIDLLSDSDDDDNEPPPPRQAPQSQMPQRPTFQSQASQHQPSDLGKTKSEDDHDNHRVQEIRSFANFQPPRGVLEPQQDPEFEEEMDGDLDDSADGFGDSEDYDESDVDDEDGVEGEDEIDGDENMNDSSSVREKKITIAKIVDVSEVEQAATPSPGRTHDTSKGGNEEVIEDQDQDEITTAGVEVWMRRQPGSSEDVMKMNEEHHDDLAESFQTQPAEVLASFQSQVSDMSNYSQVSQPIHEMAEDASKEIIVQEKIQVPQNDEQRPAFQAGDPEKNEREDGTSELYDEQSQDEHVDSAEEQAHGVQDHPVNDFIVDKQQDVPPSPPKSQDAQVDAAPKIDIAVTTVTSHTENRTYEPQETAVEMQNTELALPQTLSSENRANGVQGEDIQMMDPEGLAENDSQKADVKELDSPSAKKSSADDGSADLSKADVEPARYDIFATPALQKDAESGAKTAVKGRRPIAQLNGVDSDDGEDFRDLPEVLEVDKSTPFTPLASFITTTSQVSEAEEADSVFPSKPKRGRKTRITSSSKSAKSAGISKRGQRQVSFEQVPGSQRTTRSKAMTFQKAASPLEDKEDMSIQLARAALRSPSTKTKRKVSATSAKRNKTDLVKRLEVDMPDCAPLRDLRKFNNRVVRLDVAVVATSSPTSPKRTPTREYASSFTVTDPSVAPEAVIEINLYTLYRDHLPVVKPGDSVLLRGFTVVSLPGRGFGLKTDKNESSWAVFKAEGDDEPEMRAAPVELNDKETRFLLDLRSWYGGLDKGAKTILSKAVDELVENGRESRSKK